MELYLHYAICLHGAVLKNKQTFDSRVLVLQVRRQESVCPLQSIRLLSNALRKLSLKRHIVSNYQLRENEASDATMAVHLGPEEMACKLLQSAREAELSTDIMDSSTPCLVQRRTKSSYMVT